MFPPVSTCFHRFKDVKDKRWLQLSTTSNSRFPHCCAGPLEVASDAMVEIRGPRGDRFGTLEKGHDATCPGQKWINPSTKIWGICSVGRYFLLFFVSCFFSIYFYVDAESFCFFQRPRWYMHRAEGPLVHRVYMMNGQMVAMDRSLMAGTGMFTPTAFELTVGC